MTTHKVSGSPIPLGFTADTPGVAIRIPTSGGDITLEVPVERLGELMHLAAQLIPKASIQYGCPFDPPVLPVQQWNLGAGSTEIHARFQIRGGGAYAFSMSKQLAKDLHSGLGEALGYRTEHTHKPN
nr:hypothetical protein [uncultured Brevundimonas sp.]